MCNSHFWFSVFFFPKEKLSREELNFLPVVTWKLCCCWCFCFQLRKKKIPRHCTLISLSSCFSWGETAVYNFITKKSGAQALTKVWVCFSPGDLTFSVSWHFYHCDTLFFGFLPYIQPLREFVYFIYWKAGGPSVLDEPFNCSNTSNYGEIDQSSGTGPWRSIQIHETQILCSIQKIN